MSTQPPKGLMVNMLKAGLSLSSLAALGLTYYNYPIFWFFGIGLIAPIAYIVSSIQIFKSVSKSNSIKSTSVVLNVIGAVSTIAISWYLIHEIPIWHEFGCSGGCVYTGNEVPVAERIFFAFLVLAILSLVLMKLSGLKVRYLKLNNKF